MSTHDSVGTNRVSVIRRIAAFPAKGRKNASMRSVLPDAVDNSIKIARLLGSVGSVTPFPWINTTANALANLLEMFQVRPLLIFPPFDHHVDSDL